MCRVLMVFGLDGPPNGPPTIAAAIWLCVLTSVSSSSLRKLFCTPRVFQPPRIAVPPPLAPLVILSTSST